MLCPCWFTVQELMIMDQGWCASAIAFRARDGNSDGVALGGRTVVFAVDFPGPTLFDGNAHRPPLRRRGGQRRPAP